MFRKQIENLIGPITEKEYKLLKIDWQAWSVCPTEYPIAAELVIDWLEELRRLGQ
jgi:hypothetical protein